MKQKLVRPTITVDGVHIDQSETAIEKEVRDLSSRGVFVGFAQSAVNPAKPKAQVSPVVIDRDDQETIGPDSRGSPFEMAPHVPASVDGLSDPDNFSRLHAGNIG